MATVRYFPNSTLEDKAMTNTLKVLVAVDSSDFATEILRSVANRDWKPSTEILVLTVVEPCADWEAREEFLHQSQVILDDRIKQLQNALPQCKIIGEVIDGTASQAIISTATNWLADLIVIGFYGESGPRHSKIGSVASAVIDGASCSVDVIKLKSRQNTNRKAAYTPQQCSR